MIRNITTTLPNRPSQSARNTLASKARSPKIPTPTPKRRIKKRNAKLPFSDTSRIPTLETVMRRKRIAVARSASKKSGEVVAPVAARKYPRGGMSSRSVPMIASEGIQGDQILPKAQ
jgi:hypothetical protein